MIVFVTNQFLAITTGLPFQQKASSGRPLLACSESQRFLFLF
jgi:hypothetical protein